MKFSSNRSEASVERLHVELRKAERAHCRGGGIGRFISSKHLSVSVLDGATQEDDVGRILLTHGKSVDVTTIPIVGGLIEDADDGLGLRRVRGLRGDCGRQDE